MTRQHAFLCKRLIRQMNFAILLLLTWPLWRESFQFNEVDRAIGAARHGNSHITATSVFESIAVSALHHPNQPQTALSRHTLLTHNLYMQVTIEALHQKILRTADNTFFTPMVYEPRLRPTLTHLHYQHRA